MQTNFSIIWTINLHTTHILDTFVCFANSIQIKRFINILNVIDFLVRRLIGGAQAIRFSCQNYFYTVFFHIQLNDDHFIASILVCFD